MQQDDNIEQQNCILSNRSILRIALEYKPSYVDNNSQNTIRKQNSKKIGRHVRDTYGI